MNDCQHIWVKTITEIDDSQEVWWSEIDVCETQRSIRFVLTEFSQKRGTNYY